MMASRSNLVSSIHLSRPPPQNVEAFALSRLSAFCQRISKGGEEEVAMDTSIWVGDVNSLPSGSDRLAKLRLIVVPWAGPFVKPATRELLARDYPEVPIFTLHHNAAPTAEMAISLLLAAAKQTIPADRNLRAGDWGWTEGKLPMINRVPQVLLSGRSCLVLGYGRVGTLVARACLGLGLNVVGVRASIKQEYRGEDGVTVHPVSSLDSLLPKAEVLMVTLPGTSSTSGMINKQRLNLLPSSAILVNVGRGSVINEQDLYDALTSGHLFAAGLDVWWQYPPRNDLEKSSRPPTDCPPSSCSFSTLPNVVMSPHRGGAPSIAEVEKQRYTELERLLTELQQHNWTSPPDHPNLYNIEAGY